MADITSNLELYYTCNHLNGTQLPDTSGFGRHGTAVNGPVIVPGRFGNGISLASASSQYVNTGLTDIGAATLFATTGEPFTVALWVRGAAGAATQVLVARAGSNTANAQFWIGKTNTGVSNTVIRGSASSGSANIADGNWHHVCITWNGTAAARYVNGVADGTPAVGSATKETTQNTLIGARDGGASLHLNGDEDEVRIYSRALTAAEVLKLFQWRPDTGALNSPIFNFPTMLAGI